MPVNPLQRNINQSSITKQTSDGLYGVRQSWDPLDVREGRDTISMINFLNHKTNLEVKQVDYSFKAVFTSANIKVKEVKNLKVPIGTGVQIVKFPMS